MSERTPIKCRGCGAKDVYPGHRCQPQTIHVRISDPEHPHYPETGVLAGEMISVLGKTMALVKLDSCRHGTDACYVSKGQVSELRKPGVSR